MDSVAQAKPVQQIKDAVYANDLGAAFSAYADKIKVLSLDCFDTLLFRKTATPLDVFYDMQNRPAFKKIGMTAILREISEVHARKIKAIQQNKNEVTLKEIYSANFPNLSAETLQALEEDELAAEMSVCYAFTPVVNLINRAHAQGIKVIIVSDTYLRVTQLQRLLSACLSPETLEKISHVFCSSEHGRTKGFGLFKIILENLAVKPQEILHLGDNQFADVFSARRENIHSLHFLHFDEKIHELLRMQAVSANLFDGAIRNEKPLYSPFTSIFSQKNFSGTAEEFIGYASLGPVLYAFGRYVHDEISKLKKTGKNIKPVFLMRDAYLPSLVCDKMAGEVFGKRIDISRFASYAASFRTQNDIDKYITTILATERYEDILRQLLVPDDMAKIIIATMKNSHDRQRFFVDAIHQPDMLELIFANSKKYFKRLQRYLEKEINLQPGDTLVFIDLGYTGTTQVVLESVFREELNVKILGRYFISLCMPGWTTSSRGGLIDGSWCDSRSMHSLVLYIALFEQLCTANGPSVENYTEDGEPIYSETKINAQQQNKLGLIQSACLQFIYDANVMYSALLANIPFTILRETALAEMGRMLFLPTQIEVNYLETLQFEANLGTNDIFRVYDRNQGIESLRKRGIFSADMEKHGRGMRTNRAAEMRAASIELAVMTFAHHRFGLHFKLQDTSLRKDALEIVVVKNNQGSHIVLEAMPTFDGFYAITIPVGIGDFQLGILFGKKYSWIQLGEIECIQSHAFLDQRESLYTENYSDQVVLHNMTDQGGKLFKCESTDSLLLIPEMQSIKTPAKYIMRVVYRPIVSR